MPTINMEATGRNIQTIAKTKNIKVKEIQQMCGFGTPQAIYKWFRGVAMPTIDNMLILATIFDMKIDDIIVKN